MSLLMCALKAFYQCMRCKQRVISIFTSISYSIYEYYTCNNEYIFLDEYSLPFPAHLLQLDQLHIAKALLGYNYHANVFYPYVPNTSLTKMLRTCEVHSLPILSLELINEDNRCVKDLTTFIENIKYVSIPEKCVPTILDIVSLWSVLTRFPIDRKNIRARYITEEGEEHIVSVQDNTVLTDVINRDPTSNNIGEISDSEPK